MTFEIGSVNWLAVATVAGATFMLGGLWYTALFGKAWARLCGYSDEKLAQMRKDRPPPVFFSVMLLSYLVLAGVMAVLVQACAITTWSGGAMLGAVVWAGPVAAVMLSNHIASDRPFAAYAIDAGFALVHLPLGGAILGAWR